MIDLKKSLLHLEYFIVSILSNLPFTLLVLGKKIISEMTLK